jgi:hypothetical protein
MNQSGNALACFRSSALKVRPLASFDQAPAEVDWLFRLFSRSAARRSASARSCGEVAVHKVCKMIALDNEVHSAHDFAQPRVESLRPQERSGLPPKSSCSSKGEKAGKTAISVWSVSPNLQLGDRGANFLIETF